MCVYINKDDYVLFLEYINCAPVTRYVNTPLPFPVTCKRMIIQLRVELILSKNKKALLKLAANYGRNLFIASGKMLMKFYFHSDFR